MRCAAPVIQNVDGLAEEKLRGLYDLKKKIQVDICIFIKTKRQRQNTLVLFRFLTTLADVVPEKYPNRSKMVTQPHI